MSGDSAAPPAPRQGASFTYDAFLSYSHHDGAVASGIQKGLHRIGRRMGQLNALRVFRDTTDLSANPDLWGKVTDAMDRSRYLIVVLSPRAAKSEWVNKEVSHWLEQRGPGQVLMVVAEGHLDWDVTAGRFDPDRSDVALPVLTEPGVLPTEPRFVDISSDAPWDPQAPTFRDKVTDLAAPIHGKTKYELASDDVREQRRFRRLRRAAVAGLALLTVIAVVAAGIAVQNKREADRQRNEAEHQRDEAMARGLVAEAQSMLAGTTLGGDVRALQQLLAAYVLAPKTTEGALFDAVIARRAMGKIIQAPGDVRQTGMAMSATFSPDGQRLAVVYPRAVRVLDVTTGHQVGPQIVTDSAEMPVGMALSWDGRRLATASVGTNMQWYLRVWDIASGQQVGQGITTGDLRGAGLALSPDGQRIVTAGLFDNTVRVVKVADGQPINQFPYVAGSVAFSLDGQRLASAGSDNKVRVWDVVSGNLIGPPITTDTKDVTIAAVSPDGHRVASGGSDRVIRLWDVATGQPVGKPLVDDTSVVFSRDGQRIIAVSAGGALQLWDITRAQPIGESMVGPRGGLPAFTSDGHVVAFYGDGTLRPWDSAVGQPIIGGTNPMAISLDGQRIVGTASSSDRSSDYRKLQVWNAATGEPVGDPMISPELIQSVALSPDGQRVISGGDNGMVRVWDVASGRQIRQIAADTSRVRNVAFSPDGQRAVSVSEHALRVWDVTTGQQIGREVATTQILGATDVALSRDGHRVLTVGFRNDKVQLWDVSTGDAVGLPIPDSETAVFLSPDGRRVVTVGADGTMRVREIADGGRQVGQPIGGNVTDQERWFQRVAFSGDGRYMVSGGGGNMADPPRPTTVRVWDLDTGKQVGPPLSGDPTGVLRVAFSSDSHRIIAAGLDGVRVWPGPAAWRDELCAKLTTNMSHKEWRDWVSPGIEYHEICPGLPDPQD